MESPAIGLLPGKRLADGFDSEKRKRLNVVDYSNPCAISDLLDSLNHGKFGSVTKHIESLIAKKLQKLSHVFAKDPALLQSENVGMNRNEEAAKEIIDLEDNLMTKTAPKASSSTVVIIDSDEEDDRAMTPCLPFQEVTLPKPVTRSTTKDIVDGQTLRKTRSATRLKDIAKDRKEGKRLSIEFDRHWNPIGEQRTKYVSYVSLVARSKPNITIETWDAVDNRVKNQIWDTIRLTYDIPNNEVLKKKTLSYCAERWRAFKTQLARYYVHGRDKDDQSHPSPCSKYQFIDEASWEEFVKIRTTPTALEKRAKAIEYALKNDCPHTMSRGGYAKAERDLMRAKRKRLEENIESDPSVLLSPPSPVRREDKWLYAHQSRSGSYTSDHASMIAEKIIDLKQQEAQGSFKSEGRNDILTVATGKQEHGGRVRGVGGGVGIRDYFGVSPRYSPHVVPRVELESLLATVKVEARAEAKASIDARLQAGLAKFKEEMLSMMTSKQHEQSAPHTHSPITRHKTKGSCCIAGLALEDRADPDAEPCDLYVEDPLRRLVAHGSIHNLGTIVHHIQIQDDQLKVTIEDVVIEDAPIPIPTDEVKTVSQAKGTFILWPKHLVSDHVESSPSQILSCQIGLI